MRAQTIDWMMSLSEEIDMKRETLHLAVIYLDAYLTRVAIPKGELQLVAIACIILAFKLEQKAPVSFVDIFISEGPRGYSRARILDKERKVAIALQYRLAKNTLIRWFQLFTHEWNMFLGKGSILSLGILQENPQIMGADLSLTPNHRSVVNLLQMLDAAVFNPDLYGQDSGKLVLGAMYLILRADIESLISCETLPNVYRSYHDKYRKSSTNPIFLDRYGFNELFAEFLQAYGLELTDLIPANKFMSQYLDIELVVQEQADLDLFGQSYNKELLLYTSMK
jgi:hypothetical protein